MSVLETRRVTKVYGAGDAKVEALRGVDLEVHAGEMLAIMAAYCSSIACSAARSSACN